MVDGAMDIVEIWQATGYQVAWRKDWLMKARAALEKKGGKEGG
jgi:hypothetical protein